MLCLSLQRGESAIQTAIRKGHVHLVELFILFCCERDSDADMSNMLILSSIDIAESLDHQPVLRYLFTEFPALKEKVCKQSIMQYVGLNHFCM